MLLQRKTLICLAIALMFGGLAFVLSQPSINSATEATAWQPLFNFTETQIVGLTIFVQGHVLVFEQEILLSSQWQMLEPQRAAASSGVVRFLTNLLVNPQGHKSFPVTAAQLADYGLDQPSAAVTVRLADNTTHQLTLGVSNYDKTKVYAQVDGGLEVWVLPIEFRDAVMRDLRDWFGPTEMVDVLS
jgi:hypothetical protein